MQPLRNQRGLALLLAGGVTLLAASAGHAQDTSGGATSDAADQAGTETSRTVDDSTARNANQRCANLFGPDFARAFNQDRNDEPLNADNIDLRLTPLAEPVNVSC